MNIKEIKAIDGVHNEVEVDIQKDIAGGIKLYVNIDGCTILRIGKIETLFLIDCREE